MRVFLGIHMDTVYAVNHPFQKVERVDDRTIRGPGVVDAKGGLCVMLIALQALEQSPSAGKISWDVLINTDEEIGSPGSVPVLTEAGKRNNVGLVFEPAFSDGALVGERKGSANYSAVIRGRSAHAGRDFHHGRNAMHAAAALIVELEGINHSMPGVTVNAGRIDGGGPANVVPYLAIIRFNVRMPPHENQKRIEAAIQSAISQISQRDGISIELSGGFLSPPKPMNLATQRLFDTVIGCGRELGLTLTCRSSGGVSDGNKLAAVGLPVVDTLGPVGGNLHSSEEYLLVDSLTERAKLTAMTLMHLADSGW
jgi:glutamate carboxypeptidase